MSVRKISALAAVSIAGVALCGPTAAAHQTVASTQRSQSLGMDAESPQLPRQGSVTSEYDVVVAGLAAISPDDIWRVGSAYSSGHYVASAAHWDGRAWTEFPTNVKGRATGFDAADSASSDDVWAVGGKTVHPHNTYLNLIAHWDGTSWSEVRAPEPAGTQAGLDNVTVISADDVYASGDYYAGGTLSRQTLHWDGKSWKVLHKGHASFVQIGDAASATDAWATGKRDYVHPEVVQHWNGHTWRPSAIPETPYGSRLSSISADGPNDAWGAGTIETEAGHWDGGWLIHWDGSAWSESQLAHADTSDLYSVSADAPDDAWVTGDGFYSDKPLVTEHWDGDHWSAVATPVDDLPHAALFDIEALAPDDAWAVGWYTTDDGPYFTRHPITLHWNGKRWTQA